MKKSKSILASTMVAGALVMQGTPSNAQTGSSKEVASTEAIRPFQCDTFRKQKLDDLKTTDSSNKVARAGNSQR